MKRARPIVPVGLNRSEAASYVGVSGTTFDKLVARGLMPRPRLVCERRRVWSRYEIDDAFHDLPKCGVQCRSSVWDEALA